MNFAHPSDFVCQPIVKKNTNLTDLVLFGVIPCVNSYSRHFGTINKCQNGEQNLSWEFLLLICNAKFIVICKPRTSNDGK